MTNHTQRGNEVCSRDRIPLDSLSSSLRPRALRTFFAETEWVKSRRQEAMKRITMVMVSNAQTRGDTRR